MPPIAVARLFSLLSPGCLAALSLVLVASCGGGRQDVAKAAVTQKPAGDQAQSPPRGTASREEATPSEARPTLETRLVREKWHGDLDGIVKRRILRVLVTPGKLGFYFNGSQMQGAVYDLTREFETFLNKRLNTGPLTVSAVFIPVARERLIPMLEQGSGDLVASLVGINELHQSTVDYTDPLVDNAKAVIVSSPGGPPVSELEDLADKRVYYYADTIPYERLGRLSEALRKDGKPPIQLTAADENLELEDLLEMVNAGLVPMTVAEERMAKAWARILPGIQVHSNIVVAEGPVTWATQKNTPHLKAMVNEFIKGHRLRTAYGNTIARRYLRNEKWVKDATDRQDLQRFESLVKLFREYGDKYNFPYLLLAAQGYQESGLNANLKSRDGAVGVMQIKPSTAAGNPIGIPDVQKTDRNIEAGAKYLRYMIDQYYADDPMDPFTKGLFALASYNAGPSMVRKLREKAAAEGYDPNRWFNNVEIIASQEIGRETVQYVGNIYKYYLAYKMVTDKEDQRQAARQSSENRASK